MLEWLVGTTDLEVAATDFDYPGHSRQRCHSPRDRRGGTLHTSLVNAVAKRDEVHLVTPASLEEVFVSSEGSVEGVAIRHGDQGVETVRTGRGSCSLLAGTPGSRNWWLRYSSASIAGALYFGSQWNTGDALGIVQRMGGDVGYLDAYQGTARIPTRLGMHGQLAPGDARRRHRRTRPVSRFGDETSGYSEFAELVEAQPGRTAWMLFDREVARRCQRFPDFRELERTLDLNWSADASELAEHMRVDAEALAATLEQAGLAAAGTEADRFGRRNWERMLSFPLAAVGIVARSSIPKAARWWTGRRGCFEMAHRCPGCTPLVVPPPVSAAPGPPAIWQGTGCCARWGLAGWPGTTPVASRWAMDDGAALWCAPGA